MAQRRWLLLALALLPAIPRSEIFEFASRQDVVGIVGQDTTLPCTISSIKPLHNPEVQWRKTTDGQSENIYRYRESGGEPMQKYRGRTSMPREGFATGDLSLTLKNVQPEDEGTYSCSVTSRDWSADTATLLSIAGTGEVLIEILGPQGQGFELGCRSHGWFPKPSVQWVTEDGQGLSADTEIHQDSRKLFSVWSRVTVRGKEVGKVTCQILNPLLQMEKKTTVLLSGAVFPHVSPWLPAFGTFFTLFLLTSAACAFLVFQGMSLEANNTEALESRLERDFQQLPQQMQTLQETVQQVPESTECDLQLHRTQQEIERDSSELPFHKEFVTLDTDTAHPRLEISADGRRVTDTGVIRALPSNEERLNSHLLVKEGYTSGRYYWQEYVGSRRSWALGVALESVTHKGPLTLSPENGFWVIACADGKDYWAYTDPWTPVSVSGKPELIGILLDLSFKQVTFYDVHNGGVLYTFGIADGSSQEGKFIPFSTGSDAAISDPELLEVL